MMSLPDSKARTDLRRRIKAVEAFWDKPVFALSINIVRVLTRPRVA